MKALFQIFLIFILSLAACQKEVNTKPETRAISDPLVIETKRWFDKNIKDKPGGRSESNIIDKLSKSPEWNSSYVYLSGDTTILEIPLSYEKQTGIRFGNVNNQPDRILSSASYATILNKLLVLKINNTYEARIMKISAAPDVLESSNGFTSHKYSFYKKIDPNFSGRILYYDWKENFLNGRLYRSGEAIAEIHPVATGGKSKAMVCITNTVDTYVQGCVQGYGCSDWTLTGSQSVSTCYFSESSGSGSTNSGGGVSNGGGVGELLQEVQAKKEAIGMKLIIYRM